jgi:hypothetical protein
MPYKDAEERKEYNKKYGAEWYRRNREKTLARTRKRKQEKRKEWKEFKAGLSCLFCGMQHEAVIEFHHPEGSETYDTKVHNYVQAGQWKRAYKEVEKCIPLCSNCHRILHYTERLGEKNDVD